MYRKDGVMQWKHKATSVRETGYEHMIDTLNIISVQDFKSLSKEAQAPYVAEVLRRIREVNIYPIYYYNEVGVRNEIIKCMCTDVSFTGDTLVEHSRAGSTLLDFMFPNLHLVDAGSCTNNCMYHRFYDDAKLTKCLTRHMKNYPFTSMRTPFFMYGRFFWPTATNFSPMRAKAIFERFCPKNGVIYDFSAGFGGRMLGALSSAKSNFTYIGCEPCYDTFYNLGRLGCSIEQVTKRKDSYVLFFTGSENLSLEVNSVDFAFSCPPYYSLERYSSEETQSIIQYPTYKDWLDKYVGSTLANVYAALKPGCLLGFVVADRIFCSNKAYDLGKDWCDAATSQGFTFVQKFAMKTMSRKKKSNSEALYIFKKGG